MVAFDTNFPRKRERVLEKAQTKMSKKAHKASHYTDQSEIVS
jgi:hypothetical protein